MYSMQRVHGMEHYSAPYGNEVLTHGTTHVMLHERSQTAKARYCGIH